MKTLLKKTLLLFFVCFSSPLFGDQFSLSESLKEAQPGDYVVSVQGKCLTLFHIFDVKDSTITIEEISAPVAEKKNIQNWQAWIDRGAPRHLSWVMYELDLVSKNIEDIYSFSQRGWQKVYSQEQVFPTLISLNFNLIKDSTRKKAGPRPPLDIPDTRSIWNPPVFLDGKKVKGVPCKAYQSTWPNDGTDLSGKKIEIFLPQDEKILGYFPFWIQVSNQFSQAKMRVIDSGRGLRSVHSSFPIPPLELISHQYTSAGDLQFELKTHPSFQKYSIYFRELDGSSPIESLSFTLTPHRSSRKALFTIENEHLNNKLKSGKLYYFIFEPHEHKHMRIETTKPIGIPKPYVHQ